MRLEWHVAAIRTRKGPILRVNLETKRNFIKIIRTLVYKVLIRDVGYLLPIVQGQLVLIVLLPLRQILHVRSEPGFAIFDAIPLETQLDLVVAFGAAVAKWNAMTRQLREVFLELDRR